MGTVKLAQAGERNGNWQFMVRWMEMVVIVKMMAERDTVVLGNNRGVTYYSHQEEGQPPWLGRTRLGKAAVFLCCRPVLYAPWVRHSRLCARSSPRSGGSCLPCPPLVLPLPKREVSQSTQQSHAQEPDSHRPALTAHACLASQS